MITLTYTITEQEYKDFYYFVGWLNPDKKAYRIKYQLASILSYLIVFALIFYFKGFVNFNIISAIIFSIPLIGLYFYTNYRMKSHFHNYGRKVYNDSDKENSEMIIAESGVSAKSKDAEAHYKWSAFIKKYETDSAYYLYMATNIGLIIPKRVFRSVAEKESFEKMLAEYLPLQADLPTPGK